MIIYIHGFGSNGQGNKARVLRAQFAAEGFIAPSLPNLPQLAISTLEELIESYRKYETVHLIGSSLGGYYALYLAQRYRLKAVLINPAVRPMETLQRALGETGGQNYHDGSRYEWNQGHLDSLAAIQTDRFDPASLLVLLQTGDEVLDYSEAATLLAGCEQVIEEGGDHSFQGIERHAERMRQFFADH